MSLEELLKDDKGSKAWHQQRRRLMQMLIGTGIVLTALAAIALLLYSTKQEKFAEEAKDEREVEALTELMRIQKETEELRGEIRKAHQSPRGPRQVRRASPAKAWRPQLAVNYDPGEGFAELAGKGRLVYIPTGAVFEARLLTPIKTSVSRTFVLAETTNEYRMDSERRIPKGSRLVGRARLNPILRGVVVEFNKLVLPNGIETNLAGLALSRNALPEIEGLYFSDSMQNYGAILAFGFMGGFANASRIMDMGPWGYLPRQDVENQVVTGLGSASFQLAEEVIRDIRTRAVEYVVVPAGEPIFIALTSRYEIKQEGAP